MELRRKCLSVLDDYKAPIESVYRETPEAELRAGNRAREHAVPNAVIDRLLRKWEVPTPVEAHQVVHVVRG